MPVRYGRELAWTRDVYFTVELLDPSTFDRVRDGIEVKASPLTDAPIRNSSGHFVWLAGRGNAARVRVDPLDLPFEAEDLPAPAAPQQLLTIVLRPKPGYQPAAGATSVRGSLYERVQRDPVPVAGTDVWLQWIDDADPAKPWIDAAPRSRTSTGGDFVAIVRLVPGREPALAGGKLRARLQFDRGGLRRTSAEFALLQGRSNDLAPFGWSAL